MVSSSSLWDLPPAAELPGHVCVCRGHVDSSCLDPSSPARVSPALPTDAPHLNAVHIFVLLLLLTGHALIGVLHSSVHVHTAFSFKLQSGIRHFISLHVVVCQLFQNKSIQSLVF